MMRLFQAMSSRQLRAAKEDRSPHVSNVSGKALPFSMLVLLAGAIVTFLIPLCFIEIRKPTFYGPEIFMRPPLRKLSSGELKTMLSSENALARAHAVQELGNRLDPSVQTQLIRLLADFTPVQVMGNAKRTRLAELAKTSLFLIIRNRILTHPDNIGLLIPYFKIAMTGRLHERTAIIQILGDLKEPMARQLLVKLTSDPNPLVRQASTDALAKFELEKTGMFAYTTRWKVEAILVAGLVFLAGCAVLTFANLLFDRINFRIGLLTVIPVVLLGWITWLVLLDFSHGIADERAIDSAVTRQDIVALKAMNHHDFTANPGDSHVAQYLVRAATEEAALCLALLPAMGLSDFSAHRIFLERRSRWTLSRIIGTRLGTPELNKMVASSTPEVRAIIAEYLGRLGVKNDFVIGTLTRLTNDGDEEVRERAVEALEKAERSPVW